MHTAKLTPKVKAARHEAMAGVYGEQQDCQDPDAPKAGQELRDYRANVRRWKAANEEALKQLDGLTLKSPTASYWVDLARIARSLMPNAHISIALRSLCKDMGLSRGTGGL